MKMTLLDVAPCSLIEIDRRFRGGLMVESVRTSETSYEIYDLSGGME
jgi:hypothetical protein